MTFQGFGTPQENWSKLPHAMIAALPLVETVSELKVILYILRHTWGFHENEKRISLDEFANGRKRRGGERLDGGTGLSIPSIRDGIKRAIEHGFISVETDDSDKARVKKFYSLNQTVKVLQSDCKSLTPRVKESCNRTKKETIERNQERHVATATPAPADATDETQPLGSVGATYQCVDCKQFYTWLTNGLCTACFEVFDAAVRECNHCGKLGATTADMPDVHNVCTCEQKATLSEHFGDPPERAPQKQVEHWTQQTARPWAMWGHGSDEFQKQLQRFGDSGRVVQELGYKLEQATGIRPLWADRKKVKSWSSGLWELYEESGHSIPTAIEAARTMRESKLTIANPYSVVKQAAALAASKRVERRESNGKPKPYSDAWYDQQMANNPQLAAFDG